LIWHSARCATFERAALIAPARSRIDVRFRPNQFFRPIFRLTKLAGLRPRFQAVAESAPLQAVALQPEAAAPLQATVVALQPEREEAAESASQQEAALPAQE
jgi:hypothetical protein